MLHMPRPKSVDHDTDPHAEYRLPWSYVKLAFWIYASKYTGGADEASFSLMLNDTLQQLRAVHSYPKDFAPNLAMGQLSYYHPK